MANASSADPTCETPPMMAMLGAWLMSYILLLPLFLYVLYVGYRQWQRQSALSHTDVFTFAIIAMELVLIVGTCIYDVGVHTKTPAMVSVGDIMFSIGITGQIQIHSLTCVERYLAVVHPIYYLRLKKRGGVCIRNVSIACTWILSVGFLCLQKIPKLGKTYDRFFTLTLTCFSIALVAFCSVSVLCVLIRPGPGERGGDLRRVDQSKRRAFYTMVAIIGVLMLRFVILVTAYVVSTFLSIDNACLLTMSAAWFYLPSSLVLPLMFLQKTGKLPKCRMTGQ